MAIIENEEKIYFIKLYAQLSYRGYGYIMESHAQRIMGVAGKLSAAEIVSIEPKANKG